VPAEEALAHPLYGLRGWLRIPSIGFVLLVLGAALMLARGEAFDPAGWGAWALLGLLSALGMLAAAILWFRRWRHFRRAYLGFAVLSQLYEAVDVALVARTAEDPGGEVALVVIGILLDIAFLVAMQRSRRFRVTFEHRLRAPES
jgi:hypothetical protein